MALTVALPSHSLTSLPAASLEAPVPPAARLRQPSTGSHPADGIPRSIMELSQMA
eukprot:CAMPEP_0175666458 /NCGR_PEP_ID=MMETSP0097-20121207/17595_1 /TAXON_ID=311494 /ORGANISM="Alexandrium monilatum, Strain CCMP3105" /LENGTH=54 /DNA_ID=CAMNT_0016972883 /DNA_START=138 /DNA_END=298 /DNA_ORIENTATION=-